MPFLELALLQAYFFRPKIDMVRVMLKSFASILNAYVYNDVNRESTHKKKGSESTEFSQV